MNPTGGKAPSCVPTWRGHVETTKDALLVFEACFNGTLSHCYRRPHDRERNSLIVSGNVFVYEEATSGIKRWTDGVPWSPSRILTNFLIYRQLNSPFPPGEKKRATKRSQRLQRPSDSYGSSGSNTSPIADENRAIFTPDSPEDSSKKEDSPDKDTNRGLVGSLIDSYEFKEDGLLKKTMTVVVNGVQHHLVSYYSLEDAKHRLKTPREDSRLKDLTPRDALMHQTKFKFPNFDDAGDGSFDQMDGSASMYGQYYHPGYDTARMYAAPSHMGYAVPGSQPYPYHQGYAPPHHQPTSSTYAHMPPAPASYPALPPSGQYPQHQPQYYQQGQPVAHYAGHPPHPSPYPSHYYPAQPAAAHTPTSSVRPESRSRPNGTYEYENSGHIETGNDVYGPSSMTGSSSSEHQVPMQASHSQQWPVNYTQQWAPRSEGPAYAAYRPQS